MGDDSAHRAGSSRRPAGPPAAACPPPLPPPWSIRAETELELLKMSMWVSQPLADTCPDRAGQPDLSLTANPDPHLAPASPLAKWRGRRRLPQLARRSIGHRTPTFRDESNLLPHALTAKGSHLDAPPVPAHQPFHEPAGRRSHGGTSRQVRPLARAQGGNNAARKVFDGLPLPDHLRHVAVDKIRHHYSRPARLPLLLLSVFF